MIKHWIGEYPFCPSSSSSRADTWRFALLWQRRRDWHGGKQRARTDSALQKFRHIDWQRRVFFSVAQCNLICRLCAEKDSLLVVWDVQLFPVAFIHPSIHRCCCVWLWPRASCEYQMVDWRIMYWSNLVIPKRSNLVFISKSYLNSQRVFPPATQPCVWIKYERE